MDLALGLGLFGLGSSLIETVFGNKNTKRQARAAKMAETIRAAEQKDEQSKIASFNAGTIRASAGDRRAYGRSSKALALNQLAQGLYNTSAIESDKQMRILEISAAAARNRVGLVPAGITGFSAGLSFGSNLQEFLS